MSNIAFIGGVVETPVYFDNDILNIDLLILRKDLNKVERLTVITNNKQLPRQLGKSMKVTIS